MAIYGNMVVPSKAGAGALPTDNSDRQVYVPGSEVSGRFSDQGVVIAGQGAQQAAQGLGNLGRGIGQLGGMFVDLYDRHRRLDMAKAEEAYARLQIEGTEERTRLSRLKGANAIGADGKTLDVEAQWRDWYTKAKARHSQGLDRDGLRYFNLHADQFNATQASGVHSYFEQQLGQYEDSQIKFAMDAEASTLASQPFDSAATAASTGRIRALVHQQAVRNGWSPDMEAQAYRAAVGRMWGNAIAIQISQGQFGNAQQLLQQHGAMLSADDVAKLNTAYNSGRIQYANNLAQAGQWGALRDFMGAGQGAGTFSDSTIAARAAQYNGRPYGGVGGFDCSAYMRLIGKDQVPAQYQNIFAGSSEHMLDTAGKLSGKLYRGAEVNAGTITSGGWLIGIAEPGKAHVENAKDPRPNKIGHVAMTFVDNNGVVMVTENASGVGVHSVPLAQYLADNQKKGRMMFAANLNALPQGGALPGGYKGVPSGGTVNVLPQYKPMLEQAAQQAGVDPVLLQAIAMQESDGGRDLRTSKAGAVGLMQIMPSVAKEIGGNRENMQDNIRMGAQYFAKMLEMSGGDVHEALLRYNWGPGNVDAWKKTGKGVNGQDMPAEAREYADKVLGHIKGGSYSQPQQQAPAQGAPAAPVKLNAEQQGTFNMLMDNIKSKNMTWEQAEKFAQDMINYTPAVSNKVNNQDAENKHRSGRAILSALQAQRKAQAPAPAQNAQPAMPQAGAQPQLGGLHDTPATQMHMQALLQRGEDNDATKIKQLLPDAEYRAKTTGNCQDLDNIAGTLRQLGKVEDADKVQRLSDMYKANEQTRQAAVTMPLPQLYEKLSVLGKKLSQDAAKGLSAETHRQMSTQYAMLESILKGRVEALKADPAQAADQDPYSGIAPEMNAGDRARNRLAYQAKQGWGEVDQRMLTKAEAAGLKDKWDKAPAESKADLIDGWKKEFGENAPRLLGEIGLGPHEQDIASAVLENKEANTNLATKAFRIASLTNKEVPGFEQLTEDDIRTTVEGSEVYNVYKKQSLTTLDSASIAVVRQMKDFTKKCMKLGLASDEIKQMLDLGRKTYDEDNAAIVIPKGMDEDQFDGGLKWAIGEPLREFLKDCPSLTDNGSKDGIKEAMNRLKQTGIWVVSPFGDGFVLMDPATQSPVANDKGQFFTVTRLQIENHAERREQGEPD